MLYSDVLSLTSASDLHVMLESGACEKKRLPAVDDPEISSLHLAMSTVWLLIAGSSSGKKSKNDSLRGVSFKQRDIAENAKRNTVVRTNEKREAPLLVNQCSFVEKALEIAVC
jgi:hypothetical protein